MGKIQEGLKKTVGGKKKGLPKKAAKSGSIGLKDVPMVAVKAITESDKFRLRKVNRSSQKYQDLLASIKQHGILEPLLLKGGTLVAGYHRLDIANVLKIKDVPGVQVDGAPAEILMASYDLNDLGIPMTPMVRARAIKRAMEALATKQNKVIAKKMGRSAHFIGTHVKLMELPKEIQEALDSGDPTITIGKCHQLLRLSPQDRLKQYPRMREMTEPYFKAYIESLVETGDASWESGVSKPKKKKAAKKSALQTATKKKGVKEEAAATVREEPEPEPVIEVKSVAQVQRDIRKVEAAVVKLSERQKMALKKVEEQAKVKGLKGQEKVDFISRTSEKWSKTHNAEPQMAFFRGEVSMGLSVLGLDVTKNTLDEALKAWKADIKAAKSKKKGTKKKASKKKASKKKASKKKAAKKKVAKKKKSTKK